MGRVSYELGVTDFISRPFDALIVHRRVVNTILLYDKQKKLVGLVADQISIIEWVFITSNSSGVSLPGLLRIASSIAAAQQPDD